MSKFIRFRSLRSGRIFSLGLGAFLSVFPASVSAQQPSSAPDTSAITSSPQKVEQQKSDAQATAIIRGTVLDPNGSPISGARVALTREGTSAAQEAQSDEEGEFSFAGLAPGSFQLVITSAGFASQTVSGTLEPGEARVLPQITLAISAEVTEVSVTLSRVDIAEAEIREEEKQRVLGFVPNFYVSYVHDAAPLTPKQKFELAWKTSVDPISFVLVGVVAGAQQASNDFSGYGQGASGYGKRYGAAFTDSLTGTFFGGALFPSLFKQDPRYFYKGVGTKKSRLLYALANAVICKGDNGHWQANYSGFLGSIAAGGLSNLYYPHGDRGGGLVLEGAAIDIGAGAVVNIMQEFVVRRLTPNHAPRDPAGTPRRRPATP